MRNMMSQERNFNLLSALTVCILFSVFCVLTGCNKEQEPPVNPYVDPGTTENPNWVITVDTTNLTSSMNAIVKVSFTDSVGNLAAFMDNECCGIGKYDDEYGLYWLYISPATEAGGAVQLRFYAPNLKRIFDAKETFPYRNDTLLGTTATPYTPVWTVSK